MFCPECGSKNDDSAIFCEVCGMRIVEENTNTATEPVSTQVFSNTNIQQKDTAKSAFSQTSSHTVVAKPINTHQKAVFLVIAVCVVLMLVFNTVMKSLTDPKNVADNYFKALVQENWSQAYQYLEIEESEFVNKTEYVKHQTKAIEDIRNIESNDERKIINHQVLDSSGKAGDLTIEYKVTYLCEGDSSESYRTISLVKQPKKSFLFFDTYRVSEDNLIVKDYTISLLKGSQLYFDDKLVDKKYINPNDESHMDIYTLPSVFNGIHLIKMTNDVCEDFEDLTDTHYNNTSYTIGNVDIKATVKEDLMSKTQKDFTAICTGAKNRLSYTSLKIDLSQNIQNLENFESTYLDVCEKLAIDEDGAGITKVIFSNFTDDTSSNTISNGAFTVTLNYHYVINYIKRAWFSNNLENGTYDNDGYVRMTYEYNDGKWLLKSLDNYTLYYW